MACLPLRSADTRPGGADCEQRWVINDSECELPELAYGYTRNDCGERLDLEVYRLGAEVPESERARGEACTSIPSEGEVFRTERDDDAVPWLHRSHRGTGRLRPTVWSDDGGRAIIAYPSYFDTELDVHCQPASTTAGPRCVPSETLPGSYRHDFADEACTRPALSVGLCGPPTFVSYQGEIEGCYARIDAVYRVGDPIEVVYSRHLETGACRRAPDTSGFALEPLPLDSLAPLERVIE